MYTLGDYIKRGGLFLNNQIFPSKKKLSTIMLYATDRCNSKCKHCYIWEKTPKQHLSLETVKKILSDKTVKKNTLIGLEGGEFVLHPEAFEIMGYLQKNHPCFELLSNCVAPEKTIKAVREFHPIRLYLSLDGTRETYHNLRGVDAYNDVLDVVKALKDEIPISIMFTLTPYNNFKDLEHVADYCMANKVDMRIGIYNNMQYFETQQNMFESSSLNYSIAEIPEKVSMFSENYDYVALYTKFREGNLKLPCYSISDSIVIRPNGDVPLCQNKEIILGNVNKEPLHVIMNKKSTLDIHKQHKHNCNGCWVNFHRKYDVVMLRNLEKVLPKGIIKLFTKDYCWSENHKQKYADLIKKN